MNMDAAEEGGNALAIRPKHIEHAERLVGSVVAAALSQHAGTLTPGSPAEFASGADAHRDAFASDVEADGVTSGSTQLRRNQALQNRNPSARHEREAPQDCPLSAEDISVGLSGLSSSLDGTSIVFSHLQLPSRGLTDLNAISSFSRLLHVDISDNFIADATPLQSLTCLITLKAAHNNIRRFDASRLEQLKELDLSYNQLLRLPRIHACDGLWTLNLSHNRIKTVEDFPALPHLRQCDFSYNRLEHMWLPSLPSLHSLDVSNNWLEDCSFARWQRSLRRLNLATNALLQLPALELPLLSDLDLQDNQIALECHIEHLSQLPCLRVLNVMDNPLMELVDARMRIVFLVQQLNVLNDDAVSPEDKVDAINTFDPPMAVLAATDHALHLSKRVAKPERIFDHDPYSSQHPFPCLALVAPYLASSTALALQLIGTAEDLLTLCPLAVADVSGREPSEHPIVKQLPRGAVKSMSQTEFEVEIDAGCYLQTARHPGIGLYGIQRADVESCAKSHRVPVVCIPALGAVSLRLSNLDVVVVQIGQPEDFEELEPDFVVSAENAFQDLANTSCLDVLRQRFRLSTEIET